MALRLAVDGQASQAREGQVETTPMEAEFRVGVAHEHDGVRVRPIGDIDLATIGRLRERVDEAMATGAARIVLDLRAATFLDSSGLHLVMDTHARAMADGVEFAIIAGPPAVQHAFDVAGLSGRLPLVSGTQYL